MKKLGFLLLSVVFVMSSCAAADTVKYTVASKQGDCVGVAPMKCMQVKKGDAQEWSLFYTTIDGFEYVPGFEYVLDVKEEKLENVPADASSVKYTLVKVVSKTEKTSENMLPDVPVVPVLEWTGKVLKVEGSDIGKGGAAGQVPVSVAQVLVTSIAGQVTFAQGDTIHCELVAEPNVKPVVNGEYAFKANVAHPAHALGVYMLSTNVRDLVK